MTADQERLRRDATPPWAGTARARCPRAPATSGSAAPSACGPTARLSLREVAAIWCRVRRQPRIRLQVGSEWMPAIARPIGRAADVAERPGATWDVVVDPTGVWPMKTCTWQARADAGGQGVQGDEVARLLRARVVVARHPHHQFVARAQRDDRRVQAAYGVAGAGRADDVRPGDGRVSRARLE